MQHPHVYIANNLRMFIMKYDKAIAKNNSLGFI
jgi:hypothetical protein